MKPLLLKAWNTWKLFGKKIATIVSLVLLVLLYGVIFAPVGIVMALNFARGRTRYKASYWVAHDTASDSLYEQQF